MSAGEKRCTAVNRPSMIGRTRLCSINRGPSREVVRSYIGNSFSLHGRPPAAAALTVKALGDDTQSSSPSVAVQQHQCLSSARPDFRSTVAFKRTSKRIISHLITLPLACQWPRTITFDSFNNNNNIIIIPFDSRFRWSL